MSANYQLKGEILIHKLQKAAISLVLCALLAFGTAAPANARLGDLLTRNTVELIRKILHNTGEQFMTGQSSADEIYALFDSLPKLTDETAKLPEKELSFDTLAEMAATFFSDTLSGVDVVLKELGNEEYLLGFFAKDKRTDETEQAFNLVGLIEYDAKTGIFRGLNGNGCFGIGFDYDSRQYTVFSAQDPWTGYLGYNKFYDALAPLLGIFLQTVRVPFDYNGEAYQLQLWRGSYFLGFHGGEIGLYKKPAERQINHWSPAPLALPMSFTLYADGKELFRLSERERWWLAGFQYGNPVLTIKQAPELTLAGSVTFEDKGMLSALTNALEAQKPSGVSWSAKGKTLSFTWGK